MERRQFIQKSATFAAGLAVIPSLHFGGLWAHAAESGHSPDASLPSLKPPQSGSIPVAFVISKGAVMIDFAGPWQVFQGVEIASRGRSEQDHTPFQVYTVADKMEPVVASGMKILPDYTFANAPAPKVIVIPAQHGVSKQMLDWIRASARQADVTMSVCTGAFILAKTGLLAGKAATTHHASYKELEVEFPDIQVKRGLRFVDAGNLASAGGLSSGIDLALHVVERYFGREVAAETAYYMEYQGEGWMHPGNNAVYAQAAVSTDGHPLCPVCSMEVDRASAPTSVYKGKSYYFCSADHKSTFDAAPQKWL
jgi:putative intracellular protease/amidase/YHS domain-containing protein